MNLLKKLINLDVTIQIAIGILIAVIISLISSVINVNRLITFYGVPVNFCLSFSSCEQTPTGHVLE